MQGDDKLRTASAMRKPMLIVHVITRFIRGGADENTLITCNGQARLGHRVHLIHGCEFHPDMIARLHPDVTHTEVRSLQRELSPLADARCFGALHEMFRRLKPDLVHTHESKAGVLGRLAARLAGVPMVVHGVHILAHLNAGRLKSAIYRAADWLAAHATDLFIDVSDGMRAACLEAGFGRPERHVVIESGMDLERFAPRALRDSRARQLADVGVRRRDPLVLLVAGALEPRKRVRELVEVFADVARRESRAILLIAGDGPERGAIEARLAALGLEERVRLIGFRNDLPDWIGAADVCVHCAEREGLPRVLVQYVSQAKPVVVTELVGAERLVRDGVTGVVARADLSDLGASILSVLSDVALRDRMSAAALEIDVSAWSETRMIEAMNAAYERVASLRRHA